MNVHTNTFFYLTKYKSTPKLTATITHTKIRATKVIYTCNKCNMRVLCHHPLLVHARCVLMVHFPLRVFAFVRYANTAAFLQHLLAVSDWLLLVLARFFDSLACIRCVGFFHRMHSRFFC